MSYNTRRGNIAFNKNISSSSVGQRRPIVTNNYIPQLPPQNSGPQQYQNQGYSTPQHAQRQQNPQTSQRQLGPQPSAHQQLAKQQQMLVQKKQQLAQQQKQQQQKQQMVQQKQQLVQKQQLEQLAQQKKELELQKQREFDLQKQKELEQQNEKELDQQKQQELEQQQKQLELQKQKEIILPKQEELQPVLQGELEQPMQDPDQKQRELDIQQQEMNQHQEPQQQQELQQSQKLQIYSPNQQKLVPQPLMTIEGQQLPTSSGFKEEEVMENVSESKPDKRRWTPRRKLSKYEIQRRRNFKLSRLLQPKSGMAVLSEIVKNVSYDLEDCQLDEGSMYRATVVIDGIQHEGFGISKAAAKNNAAEKALKYLVKYKKLMQVPKPDFHTPNDPGVEPMDTSEREGNEIPLAWQQFASFAVYKLLSSWGEDPNLIKEDLRVIKKPSKTIPENANLMNPLMLLNQMLPQAQFEELPRINNGQYFTYSYKCTVNDKSFVGTGSSKKMAKRQAAFETCRIILGLEYPPEIYTPPVQISV